MVLTNWKTTLAGVLVFIMALGHCISMGKIDVQCIIDVIMGVGLVAAKDHNVTGGTKSQ